jgi:prepilin-type N-terminal cleavage/methylation domain-containing protein
MRSSRQSGFTLIEVMVTMLILGILMVGIYRIFSSQEKLFRQQEQAAEMQENLRATTEFMNQEMSWVGYQVGGLSVAYASSTELLFLSNIPNTGTTINYVRYKHDSADDVILRVVSDTLAEAIDDNNLKVLASDVDSLTFSYFNVEGGQISISDATPAVSSLMGGSYDPILRTIQRIRSNIVVMSSRPDWTYTHPTGGDHYRRRAGIIDVKARNLEDITLAGTGVGTGQCSSLALNVTVPGGQYPACTDKTEEITNGFLASTSLSDNPQVTVNVTSPSGSTDTVNTATVTVDKGYHIYDSSATQDNLIITGETLYVSAGNLAESDEGTVVTVTAGFRNTSEVGCLQVTQTETVTISSGSASSFDTEAPYDADPITAEFVELSSGNPLSPQPTGLSTCSPVSNQGIRYSVRLVDDCGNGIEGQTVQFSAIEGSFQTGTQDNGDGTYEIIYIPPNNLPDPSVTTNADTVTATWVEGSQSHSRTVSLGPGPPDHIVVEDITGPAGYGFSYAPPNSFSMQRVNNQLAQINLSVVDQCGNRVFGEELNTTTSTTYGTTLPFPYPTAEADGTYTFSWQTPDSCGDAIYGESIEIDHVDTSPETVTFDLLTTPETVLNLAFEIGIGAADTDLFAGGNAPGCLDQVVLSASILENTGQDECHNLTDPFTADFTVAGQFATLGNGSFDSAVAMDTMPSVPSDGSGKAWATLYNGEALWNQKLNVTAVVYIDGAPSFSGPPVPQEVVMKGTAPDAVRSGMYATQGYTAADVRGLLRTNRTFGAGDIIYPRMIDCDENERRTLQDPDPILPITNVTLESLLTGDVVTVPLTENLANDADFRADPTFFSSSGVETELSPIADAGDDILQVRYGDLVTMNYSDKDSIIGTAPDPFAFFNVAAISGPRWIELYYVDPVFPHAETLITSGFDLTEGDWYRPKMYFPEFEDDILPDDNGDGTQDGFGTMTITAEVNAYVGGETDVFTLREVDNTGVFVTDVMKYGVDYNTVSKGPGPGSPQNEVWLNIPYTPDRVTIGYPDLSSPLQTNSLMIRDTDLPDVSVTPPAVDAGTIPIEIFVDDIGNYIDPGITDIWLNIDGIFVNSWFDPPDNLTPPTTVYYDWVTESGGQIFWLNGQHTIYAWARDKAGNWKRSADITVTVNNPGLTDITFTQPAPNGYYSQSVTVVVQAPDLFDPVSQTYTCSLSGIPSPPAPVTMAFDGTCTFIWDISSVSDGPYSLTGVVTDNQGNTDMTAVPRNLYVDNTEPQITFNDSAGIWIPQFINYPVDFTVTDNLAGVAGTSVQFSTSGDCGPDSGTATLLGGDNYRFNWQPSPSCSAEGTQTWSVDAAGDGSS